jgi:uncharacterized protein with NAD-binding domain and iron-sulfur cluster
MGWRLGGKCASGRNGEEDFGKRIEEHGLHLWFGFYDNAFDLIKSCYQEYNRPSHLPLSRWQQAFTGYDSISLEEKIDGEWLHWPFTLPSNNQVPGSFDEIPRAEEYLPKMVKFMTDYKRDFFPGEGYTDYNFEYEQTAEWKDIKRFLSKWVNEQDENNEFIQDPADYLLLAAKNIVQQKDYDPLLIALDELIKYFSFIESKSQADSFIDNTRMSFLRRAFIVMDLTAKTIKGMIKDKVITKGFDVINNVDYREWLLSHGARPTTANSTLVQGVYGLVFGGNKLYTFEAGTALRGLLRLVFTYRGHVYYRMTAGMADVIFTPLYEVLRRRGVKFEFFHKVSRLTLTGDKKNIAAIEIDIQATVKAGQYNPYVDVKDLPCWPDRPNYDQLNEGTKLQGQDLESYYSSWQPVQTKILTWKADDAQGDFNLIVLGISIGALPSIAKELIDNNQEWKDMVDRVIPIPTIAYQLWFEPSIEELGWPHRGLGLALSGSYEQPYDTWADMSHLLSRENWPNTNAPRNIAYLCGPTPKEYADVIMKNCREGNFGDQRFPSGQLNVAFDFALAHMQTLSEHLWPGIWRGPNNFDFSKLIDPKNQTGVNRLRSQYFNANIDPSDLYVMSLTDSSRFRLKTDESGYDNLYLTGDWIDNGFNAGCIEATVMAGLQTARAMSGKPITIP